MTAFAFILGTLPLAFATGSGALSRQILGTTVIGGALAATLLAIFLIPASYYMIQRLSEPWRTPVAAGEGPNAAAPAAPKDGAA